MRAAVIGLGWWGRQIIGCLAGSDRITVTHGVDPWQSGLEELAAAHDLVIAPDFDAVLADPAVDAVILATPHSAHEAQVIAAADAGKQVFCEKPLALEAAGARRMIEACERAGIVLGLGHERRWEPAMEELRARVADGSIGRLLHVETNFSHDIFTRLDAGNWRLGATDAPAGGMTALGIHLTDFLVSLVGPARTVFARTGSIAFDPPRTDTVAVHITFASGITGLLTVLITTPFYGRFTIFGDQGWIELREISNVDVDDPAELVICDEGGRREVTMHPVANTVRMNFEAWADAVAGRADYRIKPAEMLANIELLEAIVTSARDRRPVEIG
jgi:predicted dehydrogenase